MWPHLLTSLLFAALMSACINQPDPTIRNANVTRYPNGNLRTTQEFIHDTIQDGTYVRYYEDGTAVEIEISYSNNRKHGIQTAFHRNGLMESRVSFVNGLEEGEACWYHSNGALNSWLLYFHGWKQSPALTYYDTREPKAEIAYGDSNKVVYRIDYAKDGAVIKEAGKRPEHWQELVAQVQLRAKAADTIAPPLTRIYSAAADLRSVATYSTSCAAICNTKAKPSTMNPATARRWRKRSRF